MTAKTRTTAIAAAVAAALALPGVASAQTPSYTPTMSVTAPCSENRDTSGTQYDVRLCDVTDIDQFRSGLDNNGNAYCGPASLFNSLMYLATEVGAPINFGGGLELADLDPRDPAQYGLTTSLTGWLGWKSKYDGGTKMGNLRAAFEDVTASAETKGWSLTSGNVDNRNVADFGATIAQRLKAAPVQLVYGRYKASNGALERDGGHIATVVSAKGNFGGDTIELTLADPGRAPDHGIGNYLETQSTYNPLKVTLKKVTFKEYISGSSYETELGGGGGDLFRTVTRWEAITAPYTADATRQMVEGFNWFEAKKTS